MSVASIYGFRQNPKAFYDWVKPLAQLTLEAQPNPAHIALKRLEDLNKLDSIITQNIDMLHAKAGNQQVFELHGHLRGVTCIHCFQKYEAEPILNQFLQDGVLPLCAKCQSVMKPDVILFGEQLPIIELQNANDAARRADVMLVIGSSLDVAPASEIPLLAKRTGAKIIIVNMEPTHIDRVADFVFHGDAAHILPELIDRLEQLP